MVITKRESCTGCGLCDAICPSDAIQMLPDKYGFLHPVVDPVKCTGCSLCTRKCPVSVLPQMSTHTAILAGYAKDEELLLMSSSGAIFPTLSAAILRRGGIVFGAAFDKEFNVVHTAVETLPTLASLCSSKYVQSSITKDCYAQIKASLLEGRWVYFGGMPCQVAALKNYLGREYETLITQDTACHSVPSPMVWRDYITTLEIQNSGRLTSFSFRNKVSGWEDYHICAKFENGNVFLQSALENSYQQGFLKGLYSRSSCFSCHFKGAERCSDITLADFWGVNSIQPEAYNPKGTSLILLHSEKGRQLCESCKDQLQTYPASEDAFIFNPAVLMPIQKPGRYKEFWSKYGQKPFGELVSACCKPTREELIKAHWKKSLIVRAIRRFT